jgi:hypothetical protein
MLSTLNRIRRSPRTFTASDPSPKTRSIVLACDSVSFHSFLRLLQRIISESVDVGMVIFVNKVQVIEVRCNEYVYMDELW